MRYIELSEKDFFVRLLGSLGMNGLQALGAIDCLGRPDWKMVVLPDGAGFGKATFADISAIARACGDTELVIADTYSPAPNCRLLACDLEYYSFKDALASHPDYMNYDVSVIGRSGRWLAVFQGLTIGFFFSEESLMENRNIFGPGLRH